jgi:hypothetical protein
LGSPAPRIELVILEVLYLGMLRIHQHLVEVLSCPALIAQVAYSHPAAIRVFAGLVVEVQVDILTQEPGSGIVCGGRTLWAGFCTPCFGSVDICQPDTVTGRLSKEVNEKNYDPFLLWVPFNRSVKIGPC